ncbi:MAG: LA_2272 family surface repeat-containing protein [Alkalispirochaetaceae bacterium]
MKRIVLSVLTGLLLGGALFGEQGAEHELTAQIWYPLSTNEGREELSHINLYLFYSRLGEVRGIDAGYGFSHISGEMNGFQYSGLATLNGGDLRGVSATGLFSGVGGSVRGVQWSGIGNWASGEVRGVQSAGVVNVAGDVRGVQAAGVVNVAGNVRGVQLGLVNISERMEGVPIGVINLSRNGGVQVSGWHGGVTDVNAGVRFRAGNFYTLFHYGITSESYDGPSTSFTEATKIATSFSFGAQVPFGPVNINLDAGILGVDNESLYELDERADQFGFQYRAMAELPLFWGLSLFGGVGSHYLLEAREEMREEELRKGLWEDYYFFGAGLEL